MIYNIHRADLKGSLPDSAHLLCAPGTRRRPKNTRQTYLPCAAHGEAPTATSPLPCARAGTRQIKVDDGGVVAGTVTARWWRRWLPDLPCAGIQGTRQRFELRRVPGSEAHGKDSNFAVCQDQRHTAKLRSLCLHRNPQMVTLLCARIQAHGKVTKHNLFILYFNV